MLYAVAVALFMCGGVIALVGGRYRLIGCIARCFLGVRSCGGGSQTVLTWPLTLFLSPGPRVSLARQFARYCS